jgi:hypothetical protein
MGSFLCTLKRTKSKNNIFELMKSNNKKRKLESIKISEFNKFNLDGVISECKVLDVYDGDTITVGFLINNTPLSQRLRLRWINTEEIKQSKNKPENIKIELIQRALIAKYRLVELLTGVYPSPNNSCKDIIKNNKKTFYVKFYKNDSFGRSISELYLDKDLKQCINLIMINENHSELFLKYETDKNKIENIRNKLL